MLRQLRPALVILAGLTLLTGVVYPAVVTLGAHAFFPGRAAGSWVSRGDTIVGSKLIGQWFDDPGHFWGRPSATAPVPYDADASGGSNLAPSNPALSDSILTRAQRLRAADPANVAPIPADLLTASASGLDPDISPAAAEFQVERVARVRGMAANELRTLVVHATTGRTFGLFGDPRVNVLFLNLALDSAAAERR
ncbi:MAG: potassium-transporting ATPase subunit KdpC [Gemmatimonadales bacterium]